MRAAAAAAQPLADLSLYVLVEQMIDDGVAEILVGVPSTRSSGSCWWSVPAAYRPRSAARHGHAVAAVRARRYRRRRCAAQHGPSARRLSRQAGGRRRGAHRCGAGLDRYAAANLAALVELDVNPIIVRPARRGRHRRRRADPQGTRSPDMQDGIKTDATGRSSRSRSTGPRRTRSTWPRAVA